MASILSRWLFHPQWSALPCLDIFHHVFVALLQLVDKMFRGEESHAKGLLGPRQSSAEACKQALHVARGEDTHVQHLHQEPLDFDLKHVVDVSDSRL